MPRELTGLLLVAVGLAGSGAAAGQCLFPETRAALELEVRECVSPSQYFDTTHLASSPAARAQDREMFDDQARREPGVVVRAKIVAVRDYRQPTATGRIEGWTSPRRAPSTSDGAEHDYFLRDADGSCDRHPKGELMRRIYAPICCDTGRLGDLSCQFAIPALDPLPDSLAPM